MDLHSDFSLLEDSQSWCDPRYHEARRAFVKAMRGRQYGYEPLHDAWNWFLQGWKDANGAQCDGNHRGPCMRRP